MEKTTATIDSSATYEAFGRPPIKAIYGNVTIMKYFCPDCGDYAFVIKGKLTCCDRPIKTEMARCRVKREAEATSFRRGPAEVVKKKILAFQNHQCVYCGVALRGRKAIQWDHFFCLAYSGNNSERNFVASCPTCNHLKAAMVFQTMAEAQIYIRSVREQRKLENHAYYGGIYEVSERGV